MTTSRGRRTQQRAEQRRALREKRQGPAVLPVPEHIRELAGKGSATAPGSPVQEGEEVDRA